MNEAELIIKNLGGTAETARFFGVSMASVSGWKHRGLPKARIRHLQDARPEVLPENLRKFAHKEK
jgi:hypothetical protein